MKQSKCYWINSILLFVLLSACASTNVQPTSISRSNLSENSIFSYYCSGNKQTRKLSIPIEYINPKLPANVLVDEAAKERAYYANRKKALLPEALFSLSGAYDRIGYSWNNAVVRQSNLDHKDLIEKVSSYEIGSSNYNSSQETAILVKPNNSDKFVLYHAVEKDGRLRDRDNEDPAYVSDLKLLIESFTILEPEAYQEEAYGKQDGYEPIAIDSNNNNVIADAIKSKDQIWKRYISKFTEIKEARTSNSRIINIDLSLDLNGFCQYGRSIKDLYSK